MGSVCSRRHRSEKVSCFPISSSELAGGPEGGETVQVVQLHPVSPEHAFLPRLSKAVTSCIMALICAINLYFVISYLPSLPHPAYFSLVALLAIGYLGLTAYLVLGSAKGQGGQERETWGFCVASPPLTVLSQAWTCCIAHGADFLMHSSHQHFLYGLPIEAQGSVENSDDQHGAVTSGTQQA